MSDGVGGSPSGGKAADGAQVGRWGAGRKIERVGRWGECGLRRKGVANNAAVGAFPRRNKKLV